MALINCPECGKEISDTSEVCIHCGYRLKKESTEYILAKRLRVNDDMTLGIVLIVLGVLIAAILIGIILIVVGISMINKGSKGSNCKHEIAYYNDGNKKVTFYSEDDNTLVVNAEEIERIKQTEKNDLYIKTAFNSNEFYCGKCSKTETERLEDYINKIKFGEFKGL